MIFHSPKISARPPLPNHDLRLCPGSGAPSAQHADDREASLKQKQSLKQKRPRHRCRGLFETCPL